MHGQYDARSTVTFPDTKHQSRANGIKLYGLMREAHVCEQLAQGRYRSNTGTAPNPRPLSHKSNILTITPSHHTRPVVGEPIRISPSRSLASEN